MKKVITALLKTVVTEPPKRVVTGKTQVVITERPKKVIDISRFPEKGFCCIVPSANMASVLIPWRPSVFPVRMNIFVPQGSGIIRQAPEELTPLF